MFSVEWPVTDVLLGDFRGSEALKMCKQLTVDKLGGKVWNNHAKKCPGVSRYMKRVVEEDGSYPKSPGTDAVMQFNGTH